MDPRSIVLLEFPLVRSRLAEKTSFGPSRRLAEALVPESDPVLVTRGLDETDEARALIEERAGVGIGGARDIGPAIERAARGGRLDPEQFLDVWATLEAVAGLKPHLADARRPLQRELGRLMHPLPAISSTLARSFDPSGELLDTASPRLGGLRAAVRVAFDRLRRRLDTLVGANAGPLRESLGALARFDFWAAKAQLAGEMDATRPETTKRQEVELLSARHPGLTGRVVPTDIKLGDGYTALVVTGPNTGGKTVTLRTLGLLSLMHQAGLHIPAAGGSRLPVFKDVFADIGDEQSIAQSLSTFSGHMRSIIRIVDAAAPGTLVLLDELGAGTDPTEGSALAQALLDHFIRAGALIAATTHYAELKAYAHTTPGARNASVEFDIETLSPTYRLTIGLPGGSQAFAIAERLGLPATLVADARSRLSEAQRTFEATLARIREVEGETAESKARAREAEVRAGEALRAAAEERRRAQQARADTERLAREQAVRIVEELRTELETARKALERGTLTAPAIDAVLERADERVSRLAEPSKARGRAGQTGAARAGGDQAPAASAGPPAWRVGDMARSTQGGWTGRIAALDKGKGRATLEAGTMRISVDLADLEPTSAEAASSGGATRSDGAGSSGTNVAQLRLARSRSVPMSLDLRGARVDEALGALERYLEDASLAGLAKVTVIHGLGTGALRDAVRSDAAAHPLVKTVRAGERGEGGDGVTVVEVG